MIHKLSHKSPDTPQAANIGQKETTSVSWSFISGPSLIHNLPPTNKFLSADISLK